MAIVLSGTTGIDAGSLPVNNCGNTEVEGNLNLSGVGARITGDFSNGTYSNRVAFQTSTANSHTYVMAIPNGTATGAMFGVANSSDINNASTGYLYATATEIRLNSYANGTGTQLPLSFFVSGGERMKIDTTGNVLVTNSRGGLGYGTGAGGTVTQLTSKSTAVTLNKPCGQITMNNAALAAGAVVSFNVNNSLVSAYDNIDITFYGNVSSVQEKYSIEKIVVNGAFAVTLKNLTAGSLSEAVTFNFTIIKGAAA